MRDMFFFIFTLHYPQSSNITTTTGECMEYVKEVNRKMASRAEVPPDQVVFNRSPCWWKNGCTQVVTICVVACFDRWFIFWWVLSSRLRRRGIFKKPLKFVILSNLYFILLLIYINSSEKCKIKVELETVHVFCPRVGWRKYFTFFGHKSTSSCSLH